MAVRTIENGSRLPIEPFDINDLFDKVNGLVQSDAYLTLMDFATKNPRVTIHVEINGSYDGQQTIYYGGNIYIEQGETIDRIVETPYLKKITGLVVFDTQNRADRVDSSRIKVKVEGLGTSSCKLKITAPPDKCVQCFIVLSAINTLCTII